MENFAFRGLLQISRGTFTTTVRNSNRINVRKPRPSHYVRAKIEALVKPKYFEKGERDLWFIPTASTCLKQEEIARLKELRNVDNPYERLLAKELRKWFQTSKLIAFFHANPIKFDDRFEVEVRLKNEDMFLKKHSKRTVNIALEGTPYVSVLTLFKGHTEMVFCSEPKVDRLFKVAQKMHQHVLLGAIVEDRLLSVSQLKSLSTVKDLTTARAQLVAVLNAAQAQLVSGLTFHQTNIVAGLQQYSEKSETKSPDTETIPESSS